MKKYQSPEVSMDEIEFDDVLNGSGINYSDLNNVLGEGDGEIW